jgi:hypothetical protein
VRAGRCFRRALANNVRPMFSITTQRVAIMKSRSILVPAIVAATAAFAFSGNAFSETRDAHAQAAALLSGSHSADFSVTHASDYARSEAVATDAHAKAAAQLSRPAIGTSESSASVVAPTVAQESALLSGSRTPARKASQVTASRHHLGEHPAVLVAHQWPTRGIDPNRFIVLHPAQGT